MKTLLIKNGLAVTENAETVCDILCKNGKIAQIGNNLPIEDSPDIEVIDATGKIVIPGGVDAHTHLNLDTGRFSAVDDFYSGTIAAACGGTTSIIDHPGFGPAGCDLDHQIKKYHGLAEGRAVIDYGFHGVLQHVDDKVLSMMGKLAGEGITSYKLYLTYAYKLSDGDVFKVLRRAKELGLLVAVHAENDGVINLLRSEFRLEGKTAPVFHPKSRPAECEAEAISRMIFFARMADNAPLYIVHLSTRLGLELTNAAKKHGQKNLYVETCPQYLLLDESRYSLPGNEGLKYIMCPPLRAMADREALMDALQVRGLTMEIDTVVTDHCPFLFESQKMAGKDDFTKCPSGAPGIEERIPLMYGEVAKGRLGLRRFTDLCCANPAKIFGIYPRKGVIAPGSDADIVVIDPEKRITLTRELMHGNADYTAYEGLEVQGWPVLTISRGEVIAREGKFTGAAGRGQFLKRERVNKT
ncbi:MAG: dihydropyrimidinase [Treponema sp.]|jgi:dihydropyrimidinase|nr:dihydropyrimidinase [Treponema sp.]